MWRGVWLEKGAVEIWKRNCCRHVYLCRPCTKDSIRLDRDNLDLDAGQMGEIRKVLESCGSAKSFQSNQVETWPTTVIQVVSTSNNANLTSCYLQHRHLTGKYRHDHRLVCSCSHSCLCLILIHNLDYINHVYAQTPKDNGCQISSRPLCEWSNLSTP